MIGILGFYMQGAVHFFFCIYFDYLKTDTLQEMLFFTSATYAAKNYYINFS